MTSTSLTLSTRVPRRVGRPRGTTGPTRVEGKAVSSRNALAHGIFSSIEVLPGVESGDEWNTHVTGVVQSLQPETGFELALAERAALLLWRLRRLARYETDAAASDRDWSEVDAALASPPLTPAASTSQWKRDYPTGAEGGDSGEETAPRSRLSALFHDPAGLRAERSSLARALDAIHKVDGMQDGETLPEEEMHHLVRAFSWTFGTPEDQVPPASAVFPPDPEPWPRLRLEVTLDLLTGQQNAFDIFYLDTIRDARRDLIAIDARLDAIAAAAARLRRERVLPSPQALDRVMRYESHLNRQLQSTIHELEAAQSRRLGTPLPLARLDVTGTPPGAMPE